MGSVWGRVMLGLVSVWFGVGFVLGVELRYVGFGSGWGRVRLGSSLGV